MLIELNAFTWLVFIFCAGCVGLTKTAFPALGALPAAVMALIIPPHLSIGIILIMSIAADSIGVYLYRKDADWLELKRLIPSVALGIGQGWIFLLFASGALLARVLGGIIAGFAVLDICQRLQKNSQFQQLLGKIRGTGAKSDFPPQFREAASERWRLPRPLWGSMGGFTTMVANAGGSIMSLYLLQSKYTINNFVGTQTWFFACVNLVKLPFSFSAGAMEMRTLPLALLGAVVAVLFALLGKVLIGRISRPCFDTIILILTLASALILLFK